MVPSSPADVNVACTHFVGELKYKNIPIKCSEGSRDTSRRGPKKTIRRSGSTDRGYFELSGSSASFISSNSV